MRIEEKKGRERHRWKGSTIFVNEFSGVPLTPRSRSRGVRFVRLKFEVFTTLSFTFGSVESVDHTPVPRRNETGGCGRETSLCLSQTLLITVLPSLQ